jgi:type IV pilus assembly protein PilB
LLIRNNIITENQLLQALNIQKSQGGKLGKILIDLGHVTPKCMYKMLEKQLGIKYINLNDIEIDQLAILKVNEKLVRKHKILPFQIENNYLHIAMVDPLDIYAIDDINLFTGLKLVTYFSEEDSIVKNIDLHYSTQSALKAAEQYKKDKEIEIEENNHESNHNKELIKSTPIIKIVNTIIEQGIGSRASDIHIEPYDKDIRIRYRIDGKLQQYVTYDKTLLSAIVARIKIMSGLDISEKRKPQDGRLGIKYDVKEYDLRISILPTVFGEKVVMRITDKLGFNRKKEHLGFFQDDLEKFNNILNNPYGIILVTGPTGSGKSTTLYTALNELNNEDINVVTVEDPVEAKLEGINQVQVNTKIGVSFASVLRSILRQDPDIIMIGEIRDDETASIAVKASITGHLVVSTVHTNDASSSIIRLADMGVERYLLAASMVGVIAQRLVRKLCPYCKKPHTIDEQEKIILKADYNNSIIYEPQGCIKCGFTGYYGRIGVYEIMPVTNKIKMLINENATSEELKKQAIIEGMKSLKENTIRLVLDGITSYEEFVNIASSIE